ncbi:hypothetical protein PGUG_01749 [Meyerozyma guilliermondii ATCC 6260]|uniref:tRNA-splicing endonuclease subunit Sen54 N-terminal domain-containing protein n=1 Tax=Meyerozyma guilliermondii (strain ATCC 6260 / CBS 566 / DSM 6381 / JCM 1539 / NBRC 10279 / NRRL Y-324) TaxID=294746 RepID=A5DEP8_PICGU|nr:uncharacterized protein PGUG_01749 [Meyerozyma guilliermondii ATCC 6260]EDK37651.2 hypothetical protein PGUG_01749 [Meyerozyma guilliermondii ATCC 6260]
MSQDLIDEDEDQLQDWNSVLGGKSLPKRGEKEFGPDGTETQSDNLSHARNAMYRALETPRGHYLKHKLEAIWMPDRQMAIITAAKGGYFKDLGRQTSFGHRQVIWLTGVEVTYLVERGSMMIYLNDGQVEEYLAGHADSIDYGKLFPLSLQHLYSVALTEPESLDKYLVYSYLKRHGYLIQEFKTLTAPQSEQLQSQRKTQLWGPCSSYVKSFVQGTHLFGTYRPLSFQNKHIFSYLSVYRALNIVPATSSYDSLRTLSDSSYTIHFNVWKPQPNFSKKNPPLPDFHVSVINTKNKSFPSLKDIQHLHNTLNHTISESINQEPVQIKQTSNKNQSAKKLQRAQKAQDKLSKMSLDVQRNVQYQKVRSSMLRNGPTGRSIVLATIDDGIINFITLSEADFTLRGNAATKLNSIKYSDSHGIIYTGT